MSQPVIHTSEQGGVVEIHLCRPERKNALNMAMYQTLVETLNQAAERKSVRAVILTGSDGCFTSGNDLQEFITGVDVNSGSSPLAQFMWGFTTFPKPILVAVDGPAVGIGVTLLLHCDFAFASAASEFSLPFVKLGLCPEYASSFLLPRVVGAAKANEWLLLGRPFSAQEAANSGLINAVVDNPLEKAREVAQQLVTMSPHALRKAKALLKAPILPRVQQIMMAEAEAFIDALQGPEFAEAVTAFFEKRPADFSRF